MQETQHESIEQAKITTFHSFQSTCYTIGNQRDVKTREKTGTQTKCV